MKSLRIDLGSEFDNKDVTELVERYGIEVDPTPGGAHWAGGVIEAQHGTLRRMICATVSETGLPMEDVLVGCIIATNTMGQVRGFTPEQQGSTDVDYKFVDYNFLAKIIIHGVKFIIEGGSIITSRKKL